MSKFLSIIIPRYSETEKEVFPLLSSISCQLGIDFSQIEVIIANDGGCATPLDNDFLSLFNMDIRQIFLKENRGPGVARQAGLDAANGDYVMFCDADDTLHSVGVLGALIQEARLTSPEILSSQWLEELLIPSQGYIYINHQIDATWMHGKLLRRNFLRENDIRFHDILRVHEDSYFLSIATALAAPEKNRHIPITSYVWKFNPNSITRCNDAIYTFDSFPTFIEACTMSHKEIEKRCPDVMEYKIIQFVLYIYFTLQRPEWQMSEHEQYRRNSEETFKEQIKPFWKYWENATHEKIAEIYNQERTRSFSTGVETELLEHWIERVK